MTDIIKHLQFYGGTFEYFNLLVLFVLLFISNTFIEKKIWQTIFASITTLYLCLQISSLFFIRGFISFEYYVHFNARDIISMMHLYLKQIILLIILFIALFLIFKNANRIYLNLIAKIKNLSSLSINDKILKIIRIISIPILSSLLCFEGGIIDSSRDLILMLNTGEENFEESLNLLGLENYTIPNQVQAEKGKNIVIISLESFEKGFLDNKFSHLTPNLRKLKSNWNYYDIKQNSGSKWTSGSLYTFMTGFPAYFGASGNYIFEKTYHSNITSLGHILKQANYNTTFLCSDASFSGTREMLSALQVNNIVDQLQLKDATRDKDLFEFAKKHIKNASNKKEPFALLMSTLDTHFPDGIYDERMEEFISEKNSKYEFMLAAVDYMLGDFIQFLEKDGVLKNTIIYIFPDHLKMGESSLLEGTGDRELYLITNAKKADIKLKVTDRNNLYQIDLTKMILDGSQIKHNAHFLSEYISEDKNHFIKENFIPLTAINTAGLLRLNKETYKVPEISGNYQQYKNDTLRYIAHAGGIVHGILNTNSLEALDMNYKKGFRLFELDILKTKDNKFIASHDWPYWAKLTNYKGELPVSEKEFLQRKILDQYTPLSMTEINQWFKKHDDAILITDKINEPKAFSEAFIDKNRLMMELFSWDAINEAITAGIKSAMPSQNLINSLQRDKVEQLVKLGITDIAISRNYINSNKVFLRKLKENNIRAYAFHINFLVGMDEEYVVKYELDHIYGIYADKWNFK